MSSICGEHDGVGGSGSCSVYVENNIISDAIMSSNIEDPPQVTLVQCFDLLHVVFVDCPYKALGLSVLYMNKYMRRLAPRAIRDVHR